MQPSTKSRCPPCLSSLWESVLHPGEKLSRIILVWELFWGCCTLKLLTREDIFKDLRIKNSDDFCVAFKPNISGQKVSSPKRFNNLTLQLNLTAPAGYIASIEDET